MRKTKSYLIICGLTCLVPFIPIDKKTNNHTDISPNWPTQINNLALKVLSLTEKETVFNQGFPGEISRFTDGNREIIIRWTTQPTRKLHPSVDCFKANGFLTEPLPLHLDKNGNKWSQFTATKADQCLTVSERIYDSKSKSWTDVSAWYWAASLKQTKGPWWAVTIAEYKTDEDGR